MYTAKEKTTWCFLKHPQEGNSLNLHTHTDTDLQKGVGKNHLFYTLERWYHLEINVFSSHFVESSHVFISLLFQEHVVLQHTEDLVWGTGAESGIPNWILQKCAADKIWCKQDLEQIWWDCEKMKMGCRFINKQPVGSEHKAWLITITAVHNWKTRRWRTCIR